MTQACCKVKNQNGWVTASKDNKTNLRDNYCTVSIVECEWELEQDSVIRVPGAGARLRPRHTGSECVMVRSHSDLITQYSVSHCAGVTGLGDTAMAAFYWSAAAARRARAGNMIIWSVNMINQISTRVKSSSSWEHENTFWFNAWVCSAAVISTLQSAAVERLSVVCCWSQAPIESLWSPRVSSALDTSLEQRLVSTDLTPLHHTNNAAFYTRIFRQSFGWHAQILSSICSISYKH